MVAIKKQLLIKILHLKVGGLKDISLFVLKGHCAHQL
jgi:hypothetical protein